MFTTEEKVNLLKKCQAEWIKNDELRHDDWIDLMEMGIKRSFIEIGNIRLPEDITANDIIAEER